MTWRTATVRSVEWVCLLVAVAAGAVIFINFGSDPPPSLGALIVGCIASALGIVGVLMLRLARGARPPPKA